MKPIKGSHQAQYGSTSKPPFLGPQIIILGNGTRTTHKTPDRRRRNGSLTWRTTLTQHAPTELSIHCEENHVFEIWRLAQAMGNNAQGVPGTSFLTSGHRLRAIEKGLGESFKPALYPKYREFWGERRRKYNCGAPPFFTENLLYNPLKGRHACKGLWAKDYLTEEPGLRSTVTETNNCISFVFASGFWRAMPETRRWPCSPN